MRICMILEGCYPYVTGGVSSWMHQYIQAMPQHEFVLWVIASFAKEKGNFKYQLPENVVEVREVFLDDALRLSCRHRKKVHFTESEMAALAALIGCKSPDWNLLFSMYHDQGMDPLAALMSEDFLHILEDMCQSSYPYTAFADMFHTVRSMLLPVFFMMQQKVPEAEIYHAVATGYGGLLASLASYVTGRPCILTEHGIYTREREEEIIRAKWVVPAFKNHWIQFFYMLSDLIYQRAVRVTSLFENAGKIQMDLGCPPKKCCVISNGIHYGRFAHIPPKEENGWIDIGAVVRLAPIKDIKTMLSSFYELKSRIPKARLHILGGVDDEEYAGECRQMIQKLALTDLWMPGIVDVAAYMEKLDFTILTSISEGQPLSILESFAAARPVVTTDVGCCRELVSGARGDQLGSAGYCVLPMSREALTDAMEKMCRETETRKKMGITARARAGRYYRHEDMIEKYQAVYNQVLEVN
ncbi:MAG: GT4 family glycosyltransferase PelF [Lachnospiraceae bacterium]|nr:GT4 family glycosyltransferase PelF [Lachnospiraceae bacterium]